jgi:hypothetical protein
MKHKTEINSRNERECVIPAKAGISLQEYVIPAKAGISNFSNEIPAFAGMTHSGSEGALLAVGISYFSFIQ